jgi:hypothetical protein
MSRKSVTTARIHSALDAMDHKANVSAYIVLDKAGEHVGTIRFSYPRDGMGKLQCLAADWVAERPRKADGEADFTNWTPWQYGWASGCGYDKRTAAIGGMTIGTVTFADQGYDFSHQLREAGYRIIQAI